MGFSLGSNYLLRHLGSHQDCDKICGIKAAISISGAYELPATGITIKNSAFGIYNFYITSMIKSHFESKKFRCQFEERDLHAELGQFCNTIFDFDCKVRSKYTGYRGGHELYRAISCNAFIPHIRTPLLAIAAKDDPITLFAHLPIDDMKRNENIILAILNHGGHCDFYSSTTHKKKK